MGAFFGGRYKNMLAMAADRSAAIDTDYANNLEAVWHDESHLNRYVFDHPPDVLLPPSYCYPEGSNLPFEPRILALDKDHAVVRSTGMQTWMIRGERLARACSARRSRWSHARDACKGKEGRPCSLRCSSSALETSCSNTPSGARRRSD